MYVHACCTFCIYNYNTVAFLQFLCSSWWMEFMDTRPDKGHVVRVVLEE